MAKRDPELIYSYTKIRKNFGKQPQFCETPAVLLDNIDENSTDQKLYCLRNPVNHETQTTSCLSEHYVNTKRVTLHDQGVQHIEGGWPKDVSFADEEATARYRRRIERDENYVDAIISLCPKFKHYIDQNNAVELYNMYFKEIAPENAVEKSDIRIINVFKDFERRPISSIGWTLEDESKLVVAYCDKQYPVSESKYKSYSCFVWNVELSSVPVFTFCPPSACWQVACSPVNPSVIIGGLHDGRVCIFDIRTGIKPVILSKTHLAHRDPVTSLLYLHSRLNNEFFSGSTDGLCMWWDIRNVSDPIDLLIMSIRIPPGEQMSMENAEGVSALQYDKAFPTKFLCGTDTGFVINVNRKGKTHAEVMGSIFQAHNGPVKSLHRHSSILKIFITCGDWKVNIWSDDVLSSPIITGLGHRYQISDVVWAPQRVSCYMSVGMDGKLRYWDLLRRFRGPVAVFPVSKYSLLKVKPHDDGKFIAVGDIKGTLKLLSLSENLVISGKNDKQLMVQTFDRETRREHILEARVKEILLRLKTPEDDGCKSKTDSDNYEAVLRKTEDEYRKIVSEELNSAGIPMSSRGIKPMRKR